MGEGRPTLTRTHLLGPCRPGAGCLTTTKCGVSTPPLRRSFPCWPQGWDKAKRTQAPSDANARGLCSQLPSWRRAGGGTLEEDKTRGGQFPLWSRGFHPLGQGWAACQIRTPVPHASGPGSVPPGLVLPQGFALAALREEGANSACCPHLEDVAPLSELGTGLLFAPVSQL